MTMMKKLLVIALLVAAAAGCDFDGRKFESAQHCLPSSKFKLTQIAMPLGY